MAKPPPHARRILAGLLATAYGVAPAAQAAPLETTLAVSSRLLATDNVDLAVEGRERSALVWTNSAGVSVGRQSSRTFLSAAYTVDLDSIFAEDRSELEVRQTLDALAQGTLVRELLFVEAQATAREELAETGAPVSLSGPSGQDQRLGVQTVRFSPYLAPRLGRDGSAELRYQYARVFAEDGRLSEPESHLGRALVSLRPFGERMQATVLAEAEQSKADGTRADSERRTGELRLGTLVARGLTLEAMGGWEELESGSFRERFSGVIWSAGLSYQAGRRVTLSATAGSRYEDPFYDATLTWTPSPKSSLTASYARTFVAGLDALTPTSVGIDPDTGLPTRPPVGPGGVDDQFGLRDEAYRSEQLSVNANTRQGEDLFSLGFAIGRRGYDLRPDEEATSVTFGWSRPLARDLRLETAAFWRRTEIEGLTGTEDAYGGRLGLTWTAGPSTQVSASLSHSGGENRAGGDYTENALSLGVSWRF